VTPAPRRCGEKMHVITIEQRLQDPARFLIMPADEAIILGLPILMGLLGRQAVAGIIVGFLVWAFWKRLKGEGGLEAFLAATYWFLPQATGLYREFPDSAFEIWEA
jgi:type IV conjugative transfer system protein TraL